MKRNNEGSIVLEASLILPFFLSFIILLASFIRIGMVEIALNHATGEAVKQVSTHFYPIDLIYRKFNQSDIGSKLNEGMDSAERTRDKIIEVEELVERHSNLLPMELQGLLKIREGLEETVLNQYDQTLSTVFQPIMDYYVDKNLIQLENLYVTKVVLPNLKTGEPAVFGMEVRYDMPLHVPFFNRVITFKTKSYERVWIGGQSISSYLPKEPIDQQDEEGRKDSDGTWDEENKEKQEEKLYIDSINSPVQRGKNLRIIARGPPNQRATVIIYYQSGFVKDKSCSFNEAGWLTCDIPIGGHANEGEYQALVKAGGKEATGHFVVLSKSNMENFKSNRAGSK